MYCLANNSQDNYTSIFPSSFAPFNPHETRWSRYHAYHDIVITALGFDKNQTDVGPGQSGSEVAEMIEQTVELAPCENLTVSAYSTVEEADCVNSDSSIIHPEDPRGDLGHVGSDPSDNP